MYLSMRGRLCLMLSVGGGASRPDDSLRTAGADRRPRLARDHAHEQHEREQYNEREPLDVDRVDGGGEREDRHLGGDRHAEDANPELDDEEQRYEHPCSKAASTCVEPLLVR